MITPRTDTGLIAAIILSIALLGMTSTFTVTFFALMMDAKGINAATIGASYTLGVSAVLVAGPFLPRLLARLGTMRMYVLLGSTGMIAALLLSRAETVPEILFGRFFLGGSIVLLFVLGETCLNNVVPEKNRGRILGIYLAVLAVGVGFGPLLADIVGIHGAWPFYTIAALFAVALSPLFLHWRRMPHNAYRRDEHILKVLFISPMAAIAGILFGMVDGSMWALLSIYGLRAGLVESEAVFLFTMALFGGMAFQVPVGWLADLMDRRKLLLITIAASGLGSLLLPQLHGNITLLYAAVFIWGGIVSTIYTVGLAILGERFAGHNMATATVVLIMMFALGSLVGPPVAGAALERFGAEGFPYSMFAACCLCFIAAVWRYRVREKETRS